MSVVESQDLMETKLVHVCEVCGKTELLTPKEAFDAGWDYPPLMGAYAIISPRTCPDCSMEDTAWAELVLRHKTYEELSEKQKQVILRILHEPASLMPENEK